MIMGSIVKFQGGDEISFDAIVFATGYKSTANIWLKVLTWVFLLSLVRLILRNNCKSSNQVICYL
jgi:hypothetical protein